MTSEDTQFAEFVDVLHARALEYSGAEGAETDASADPGVFREDAYTAVAIETLEDLGQIPGGNVCYFERRLSRGNVKLNGWYVDEDTGQLDLFTTIYRGPGTPKSITRTDLAQTAKRAARALLLARDGYHIEMEAASAAFDMMQRIHEVAGTIDRVRVLILADGLAADVGAVEVGVEGADVQLDVWDLRRLFRASASGLSYEPIEIDLVERTGSPLPCLPMMEGEADYMAYLAILPGNLIHSLYHEFGARLLELNVRSFLQARGKVNRGIRDTLRNEPARFLAYNNGISATAESVELEKTTDRAFHIRKVRGLQIVNGGQTVASIHHAREKDKIDLSDVQVQAKITIVRPEDVETLVSLISRYANTQNRVSEADFSANYPYHVQIQKLSQSVWAPGEQSRWFYERARGQYQVAKSREGDTPARRRRFEITTPPSQKFDKVALAKYLNAWGQLPHIVSRGGQKNFVQFMDRLVGERGSGWEPDSAYFRALVSQAIIFKRAEKIARQHAFPAYRANAIAYTVAMVSYRTAGRVNLNQIWDHQAVSNVLADTLYDWMTPIYSGLVESAQNRNVTEWCKKEDCWRHIQTLPLQMSSELESELAEGMPLPTVGSAAARSGKGLTTEDRENIARVMQVTADEWLHICGWGSQTGQLAEWQVGIAGTLATYAVAGWNKVPSGKQALQGARILRIAEDEGGRLSKET